MTIQPLGPGDERRVAVGQRHARRGQWPVAHGAHPECAISYYRRGRHPEIKAAGRSVPDASRYPGLHRRGHAGRGSGCGILRWICTGKRRARRGASVMTGALLISMFLFGSLGYRMRSRKRRPILGTVLGLGLGLVGIIILLCVPTKPPVPG